MIAFFRHLRYDESKEVVGPMEPFIDKDRFGEFVSARRKRLGLTQRELAGRLYVSCQAVSKWETGLSLPDVGLLIPLAEALEVTVTELLEGRRLETEDGIGREEVERLLKKILCSFPVFRVSPWVILLLADLGAQWCLFSYCDARTVRYLPFALLLRLLFLAAGYFLPERTPAGGAKNRPFHLLLFFVMAAVFSLTLLAILFWRRPDCGFVLRDALSGVVWLVVLAGSFLIVSGRARCDFLLSGHMMAAVSSLLVFLSDQGILADYGGRDYLLISNSLLAYLACMAALCAAAFLKHRQGKQ